MKLRDYFAAKAMQGLIINPGGILEIEETEDRIKALSIISYRIADCMIEKRKK